MNVHLIILAAGSGKRIGSRHKALIELLGKPMLYWCLKNIESIKELSNITVVAHLEDLKVVKKICADFPLVKKIVRGGKSRQESAHIGIRALTAKPKDIVLFHNVANIFADEKDFRRLIKSVGSSNKAVFLGQTLYDTPKKVIKNYVRVSYTKHDLVRAQTPQAIVYDLAMRAFDMAKQKNLKASDDVGLVEEFGVNVRHLECSNENFKITNNQDLILAEKLLRARQEIIFGIGEDSHKFTKDKDKNLILGTVTIPKAKGLEADSDGDLILHAIYNAISSAMSKGSIGKTATLLCKEGVTDSSNYVYSVLDEVAKKQFMINNVSISLEAARPKLERYLPRIKKSLAKMLDVAHDKVGITVTSGDTLGPFGRGEGIKCTALVSMTRIS